MTPDPSEGFYYEGRVYWEDTDGGGVVYHANYLRFMERARTEWLRTKGYEQRQLLASHGVVFVVYALQIQFAKPARLDDHLRVSVALTECRRATFIVHQRVVDVGSDLTLASAAVEIASINAQTQRPVAMPPALRAALLG